MKHPKCVHSFEIVADLPESLAPIRKLAYNLRWTWDHETRSLFREIDRDLFEELENNPVQLLNQVSKARLEELASDELFLSKLTKCHRELEAYLTEPKWYQKEGGDSNMLVAYFCAEFGVSESIPIYSGGLGVLAGDHLKAASDLGLPLVGVGLLYARGYFRQFLTPDGWQQEKYEDYDFYRMPLSLERGPDGQPLLVQVDLPDRVVTCQIWRADVGRVPLYLLDSNVLENLPTDQGITDTLYGGDEEMRIRQEMILGIGGLKALRILGLSPTVCHMNEGHSAFLSIERIRQFMEKSGCDFRTGRQVTVHGNVFTTHTPVPAGFDLFPPELFQKYLGHYADDLATTYPDILKMGRMKGNGQDDKFNMAVLAMENSNFVNGVSKLHANVSRAMFSSRWPDFPVDEIPIEPITNGVHTATWVSSRMARLFDQYLGKQWRYEPNNPESWEKVYEIPDAELWSIRDNQRGDFVRFARRYIRKASERRGMGRGIFGQVESILDPRILTIGFARRFATYKRATLMLTDIERLKSLLFHPERPIQIVIAGKSHPRDDGGKSLIQQLVRFIAEGNNRSRIVFLEDYDMRVARAMIQGVDLWLNNPRRPMEASGTSGMKVVANGGLNCSILDGWWDEGYDPKVGWAIGDRVTMQDEGQQDWFDSRTLYHLIENEIAPTFYHRIDGSVPLGWVEMMKHSIAKLAPQFSTARMVQEYCQHAYMPSHQSYIKLANDTSLAGAALLWRGRIQSAWHKVRVLEVTDNAKATNRMNLDLEVKAKIDLDGLSPEEVRVQVVIGQVGSNRDLYDTSVADLQHESSEGSVHYYRSVLNCDKPGNRGYTVRVIPHHENVNVMHEIPLARWEGDPV